LTETNFVSIVGEVNEASISDVMIGISKSDPSKPLYLYLDTPGGEVFAGKKLVDYLHSTDRNIVCIASMAISMGFVTLQSCKTRLITRDGILMTHQIASQVKGSLHDIENQVSLLRKLELLYDTMISRRMELTLEAYQAKLNP
jgi:ATP-dependent Clp protease protease subunit